MQISSTCTQCASRACVKLSDSGQVDSGTHGPNVGAIAGGVVGGCAFIAIVTFLIWRLFLRSRRQTYPDDLDFDEDEMEDNRMSEEEKAAAAAAGASGMRSRRGSAHSARRSIASTVLTRASNIIPIAFIPHAVDRGNGRNLVPPVPLPTTVTTPYSDQPADHYFMPSDLRDSHYSGFTDDADRASTVGRASITPSLLRGSVASTIFGSAAVVGAGQTGQRGKAAVVSVPAVPRVNYEKYSGTSATVSRLESVPQGQQLPATTYSPPKPERLSNPLSDKHAIVEDENEDGSESMAVAVTRAGGSKHAKSGSSTSASPGKANLSRIIEQATRRASRLPRHGGLGSMDVDRGQSPFGDEHEVVEDALPEEEEDEEEQHRR